MKSKYILLFLICAVVLSCRYGTNKHGSISQQQRPNIVFILADDFGIQDMGFMGSTFYNTPNIDRLAAKSMVFTNGYAGSRVCSPSRATIMTGKFTARHGITNWIGEKYGEDWRRLERHDKLLPAGYVRHLPHADETLAEALQSNGYATFFAGKWHLGNEGSYPENHGFDINIGGWEMGSPMGGFYAPFENPKLKDQLHGQNLSLRLASETNNFITAHKDSTFFAFLSFYAVHAPIQTTQQKWQKYRNKVLMDSVAENGFVMERKLPIRVTQDNPVYAGLVETMDEAIGSVLTHLDELGLMDNTIIVFTSDNGGVASGDAFSTSNLPFKGGKGYHWEGGIREPFLISVPRQTSKGAFNDYPVTGADFYPTLLDYADIALKPEQHKDGISLKQVINDNDKLQERSLFWHYPHYGNQGGDPSSVIRKGDWKLIHYYEENSFELYNLKHDPYERSDLSDENETIAKALHTELMSWLNGVGAQFPVNDVMYDSIARNKRDRRIMEELLPQLEQQRKQFLEIDYQPDPTWWGSKRTVD